MSAQPSNTVPASPGPLSILAISVNHGTTDYAELMIRSLLHHHSDRRRLQVLLLDNDSPGAERLHQFASAGISVRRSGYSTRHTVTTHGEILAAAVLDHADHDAYLFLDSDICFRTDHTIDALAAELEADPGLFGVQARWLRLDETPYEPPPGPRPLVTIKEAVRPEGQADFGDPVSYQVRIGDRLDPYCALIRNTPAFRRTVESVGLSPAAVQSERTGRWWDTFGLMTQVMATHGLGWRTSSPGVIHFGSASWQDDAWTDQRIAVRDRLLAEYRGW